MANLKNTIVNDTGFLKFPSGSINQRPNTPYVGYTRMNTESNQLEIYDGTEWKFFTLEAIPAVYNVTDSTTTTDEGTTITFTVTTQYVEDGTTLYYTLSGVDSNDVSTPLSGNFTINNNSGSVDVSITNDETTEGSETLTFQVRVDSTVGEIVTTDPTNINDTSIQLLVTDGLVLHYDFDDTNCWDGTSSTIYDLTNNNHDATVSGSPGYTLVNGYRVFETNGSSSYFKVSTPNLSSTNHTVMVGSRYTTTTASTSNNSRLLNAVGNNWLLGHWYYTVDKHYAAGWVTDSNNGDVTDTNWRIYTALGNYSSDTWGFYINNSLNVSNSNGAQGPNGFAFGIRGYSDGEYAPGQISFLLVYNRLLSPSEMTQNYNVFKDRLGLS